MTTINLTAGYNIDNTWTSGYQVTVTINNNNDINTNTWTSTFQLPQNQKVTDFWNCQLTSNNNNIIVTNPSWIGGGIISSGSTTSYGMIVNVSSATIKDNILYNLQAVGYTNNEPNPTPPLPPVLDTIIVDHSVPNNYTLTWNNVNNATSYSLQEDTTNSFNNPTIVVSGFITTYTITNKPNGTYYYRVFASNTAGTSQASNIESITINITPITLTAPVLDNINNSGSYQYLINWSSVTNTTNYRLIESNSSTLSNPQIIYYGPNTSFNMTSQPIGTYYYTVTATNGSINSPQSNIVQVNVTVVPSVSPTFVESYWESWNIIDPIEAIVGMNVNIINISFVTFTPLGNNTFSITGLNCTQNQMINFITAAHDAGKKVKISVGGATYGLQYFLNSMDAAAGMANTIAQFVLQNSLDGVDFDIEDYPPANLQIALLQNVRQLLPKKLISYTPKAPASTTIPYCDVIKGGYQYVDTINIMAYDTYPGYLYESDVQSLISMSIPYNKIVIGLMPGYDNMGVLTSLTDVSNACHYIVQNKLAGLMYWDLNRDYENKTGLGSDAVANTSYSILN